MQIRKALRIYNCVTQLSAPISHVIAWGVKMNGVFLLRTPHLPYFSD